METCRRGIEEDADLQIWLSGMLLPPSPFLAHPSPSRATAWRCHACPTSSFFSPLFLSLTQPSPPIAKMWLRIASALIFGALGAARVINSGTELLPQLSARLIDAAPPVLGPVTAGVTFDPNNLADQATRASYVGKGNDFVCRMEATDKGAGFLMQDTRNPPSSASQYTGDLSSKQFCVRIAPAVTKILL
jgi:hypothetical protein